MHLEKNILESLFLMVPFILGMIQSKCVFNLKMFIWVYILFIFENKIIVMKGGGDTSSKPIILSIKELWKEYFNIFHFEN